MFKPQLKLSFVKAPKTPSTDAVSEETSHVDLAQIVRENTPVVAKYIAIAVVGWKVLDTASQCAIKITPQH